MTTCSEQQSSNSRSIDRTYQSDVPFIAQWKEASDIWRRSMLDYKPDEEFTNGVELVCDNRLN